MHFSRARLPQQGYNLPRGRAAYDRVVDHDHAPALHAAPQRAELDAHRLLAALLAGGDKRAAHIAFFDQARAVRDAGLLGVCLLYTSRCV